MQEQQHTRFGQIFCAQIETLVAERDSVLGVDLGCGSGRYARQLAAIGTSVVAVDRELDQNIDVDDSRGVDWREQSAVYWHGGLAEEDEFDFVFARNILHFLPKLWVTQTFLPDMKTRIRPGGVIGIATFYREPEPPIPVSISSLYPLDELRKHFEDWDPVLMMEWPHRGKSLFSDQIRQWWSTLLIVRKPDESQAS